MRARQGCTGLFHTGPERQSRCRISFQDFLRDSHRDGKTWMRISPARRARRSSANAACNSSSEAWTTRHQVLSFRRTRINKGPAQLKTSWPKMTSRRTKQFYSMRVERVTFVIKAENRSDILATVVQLFHGLSVEVEALYMVRRRGSETLRDPRDGRSQPRDLPAHRGQSSGGLECEIREDRTERKGRCRRSARRGIERPVPLTTRTQMPPMSMATTHAIYVLTTGGTMEKVYSSRLAQSQTSTARLIVTFGFCGCLIAR